MNDGQQRPATHVLQDAGWTAFCWVALLPTSAATRVPQTVDTKHRPERSAKEHSYRSCVADNPRLPWLYAGTCHGRAMGSGVCVLCTCRVASYRTSQSRVSHTGSTFPQLCHDTTHTNRHQHPCIPDPHKHVRTPTQMQPLQTDLTGLAGIHPNLSNAVSARAAHTQSCALNLAGVLCVG